MSTRQVFQVSPETGIVAVIETMIDMEVILALPYGHHLWLRESRQTIGKQLTVVSWYRHFVSWDDMSRWGYGTPDRYSWQHMENVPDILKLAELLGE